MTQKTAPPHPSPSGDAVDLVARALAFVAEFDGDPRCSLNCMHAEALAAEVERLRSSSLSVEAVRALGAKWRKEAAEWLHGIGENQNTRLLTKCGDELEALLPAPPEVTT